MNTGEKRIAISSDVTGDNSMKCRFKLVQLRPENILDILNTAFSENHFLYLPVIDGLPPGYRIVSISADWITNTFKLIVWHSSFPEVPVGSVPPMLNDSLWSQVKVFQLQRTTDVAIPKNLLVDIRNAIVMYPHDNELILTIDGMLSDDSPAFIVPENIST